MFLLTLRDHVHVIGFMCNLAGYTGMRRAAPILLDMMRAQEGFGSGFYTGIATLHEGRIYWAKVRGDVEALVKNTEAVDLPGTTGFAHGRPDMGGDREWAHPFLDGKERLAYAANGHAGFFENPGRSQRIRDELHRKGASWRSRIGELTGPPGLDQTHGSEDKALHIADFMDQGLNPRAALESAFREHPGELAALMLEHSLGDTLLAARISQPLMLGACPGEMFAATTAMAFPCGLDWIAPLPVLCTAELMPSRAVIHPMLPSPGRVADLFPWHEGERRMWELLESRNGECEVQDFKDITSPLWSSDAAPQKDHMVYEILRRWKNKGRISFSRHPVASDKVAGLSGPRFRVSLEKTPGAGSM